MIHAFDGSGLRARPKPIVSHRGGKCLRVACRAEARFRPPPGGKAAQGYRRRRGLLAAPAGASSSVRLRRPLGLLGGCAGLLAGRPRIAVAHAGALAQAHGARSRVGRQQVPPRGAGDRSNGRSSSSPATSRAGRPVLRIGRAPQISAEQAGEVPRTATRRCRGYRLSTGAAYPLPPAVSCAWSETENTPNTGAWPGGIADPRERQDRLGGVAPRVACRRPLRASACSMVSTVRTPNAHGTPSAAGRPGCRGPPRRRRSRSGRSRRGSPRRAAPRRRSGRGPRQPGRQRQLERAGQSNTSASEAPASANAARAGDQPLGEAREAPDRDRERHPAVALLARRRRARAPRGRAARRGRGPGGGACGPAARPWRAGRPRCAG